MNRDNFDSMIKKYTDELIKMSSEKSLPDVTESPSPIRVTEEKITTEKESFSSEVPEAVTEEAQTEPAKNPEINDSPLAEDIDLNRQPPENSDTLTGKAKFSARVFTGNNAYPIENAKVLVVRDNKLFTYLVTDRNGKTKTITLPSFPESNSLDEKSEEQYVNYTGEVYAAGFTPKKDLLITAVGGSDIVLNVQMTPESERVN